MKPHTCTYLLKEGGTWDPWGSARVPDLSVLPHHLQLVASVGMAAVGVQESGDAVIWVGTGPSDEVGLDCSRMTLHLFVQQREEEPVAVLKVDECV